MATKMRARKIIQRHPFCKQCGVADRPAHRDGIMHKNYDSIVRLITQGKRDTEILRTIGLDPSEVKWRVRLGQIRKRLTRANLQ